jgi:hypothetical protein
MKVEARKVHVLRDLGAIKRIEPLQDAAMHPDIDLSGGVFRPKFAKALMTKRLNHSFECKRMADGPSTVC